MNNSEQVLDGVAIRLEKLGWSRGDIDAAMQIADEFSGQEDVTKVWLYGSMARGAFDKNGKQSDMDISVEKENLDPRLWKSDRRVLENGRPVQIQIFRSGYDEETAARRGKDVDPAIAFTAATRLHDQIILWEKER